MKKFLLLVFISLANINLFAQSLELIKKDGSAIVNDTILIVTADNSSDMETSIFVKNISDKSLDVWVKLYVQEFVTGSSASYCWNNCFDIATTQSTDFLNVSARDTIKAFHSDFSPSGNNGITKIMYTFFVNKNENDSVSVTINYEVGVTGIDNLNQIKESISSYPNPVKDIINFDYSINNNAESYISIYDLVGKKVKQLKLNNLTNSTQLDISDLNAGIYIWAFEINGISVKSDKLIKK